MAGQVLADTPLSRPQAERLVGTGPEHLHELFRAASKIRQHFLGRRVRCCSIAAAKVGRCPEDCAFCSQSAHYKTHVRGLSVLDPDEVFQAAMNAASNGAEAFGVVTSGYGPTDGEIEHWGPTIGRIRATGRIGLCASMGVVTERQARRLAELGVQRYNLNLQTSRRHFPNIVKTHTYDQRRQSLRHLQAAGITLFSGALFGMGETWADRLDLAFELRGLGVEVVPINLLVPIPGTPLAGNEPLTAAECLKIIAIYRFLLPRRQIKIAGGRELNLRELQSWIFYAGADSFLIGNYLTTCGRPPQDDAQMLRDLGLELELFPQPVCPSARSIPDLTPTIGPGAGI